MKKCLALLSALALMLVMASCGETATEETSSAAPTTAPVSTAAPVATPTPEPTATPEPKVDANIAHAADATYVDMNTGKTAEDEGYIAYYDDTVLPENAFDANTATGWQTCEDYGGDEAAVTEDDVNAAADPSLYYQSALDNTKWFLKPTYEDGSMWVGVTFAEAKTVDDIVILWENGSAAEAYDDGYYLEFTADGEKWEKLDATVTRDEESRVAESIFVDEGTFEAKEVMGVRVVLLKASSKYAPKIWEIELYAPEEAADEATAE